MLYRKKIIFFLSPLISECLSAEGTPWDKTGSRFIPSLLADRRIFLLQIKWEKKQRRAPYRLVWFSGKLLDSGISAQNHFFLCENYQIVSFLSLCCWQLLCFAKGSAPHALSLLSKTFHERSSSGAELAGSCRTILWFHSSLWDFTV